jgi:hypothetical protein
MCSQVYSNNLSEKIGALYLSNRTKNSTMGFGEMIAWLLDVLSNIQMAS